MENYNDDYDSFFEEDELFNEDDLYEFADDTDVNNLFVSSEFDPNGSYTGTVSDNPNETPVQDADDL